MRSFLKLSSACLINVTRQVDLQQVEVRYHSRVSNSRTTTEMNAPMTLSTFPKVCFHTAVATMIEGALAYVTCRQCDDSIVVNSSSLAHLDLTGLGSRQRWEDFPHMDSQVCLLPNLVPDHDSGKCEVCSTAASSPDTSKPTCKRTDVNYETAAPTAVKMSKSAKKKRRKKRSLCQPTREMHSQSLRPQGSPLVPPSLGGATLGPSSPAKVRHLFLGQDSLVQAPVLKKPAYSHLSHCPCSQPHYGQ